MKIEDEAERISEIIKEVAKKQLTNLLNFKKENYNFIELELKVCKNLNDIGASILQEIIPLIFGDGYQGSKVYLNNQIEYHCVARNRERGLATAFGDIKIKRAIYIEPYHNGIKSFLDEELDIENKRKSPLVNYWADLLGTVAPFDEAKTTLEKIRGISISSKQIELSTESLGKKITESHDQNIKDIQIHENGEISPLKINLNLNAERTIYIETDGCHINTSNDWKECKTFMLFETEKISEKEYRLKNRRYYSTMKDVNEIKKQLHFYIEKYCENEEVKIVCIGDGAKWIWNTMSELFPKKTYPSGIIEILDWYHAIEKIGDIKKEIFNDEEKGKKFYDDCEEYLFKGNIEVVMQLLEQLKSEQKLKVKKEFVDQKLHYFMNNKNKMRYDLFKKQELCIGSGAIESANKYVVQRRLKLQGMKWNEENANYMAHLRAEYINEELEKHYNIRKNALINDFVMT